MLFVEEEREHLVCMCLYPIALHASSAYYVEIRNVLTSLSMIAIRNTNKTNYKGSIHNIMVTILTMYIYT